MPPPGCPPLSSFAQTISRLADTYYSNEDIKKLHAIVIQADKILPEKIKPTTALLSAYYSELSYYKDPDPDYRFVAFLFTIGTLKGPGTLFDKFERVLYEIGIDIVFDSSETGAEQNDGKFERYEAHSFVAEESTHQDKSEKAYDLFHENSIPAGETKPHRRNSDSAVKPKRPNTVRFFTFSSYDFSKTLHKYTSEYSKNGAPWSQAFHGSIQSHSQESNYHQDTRSGLDPASLGRLVRHDLFPPANGSLLAHKGTPRVVSIRQAVDEPAPVQNHVLSKENAQSYQCSEESSVLLGNAPIGSHFSEPESSLYIRASVALNWRLALFVKDRLQTWKKLAMELRIHKIGLEDVAISFYRKTVFRHVFHNWWIGLVEKRENEEIEIFYKGLEERATRARDLYLSYIALSHWSNHAAEQVQKTALARRNIIQTRVFNAWRDITIADDITAQHHFLNKYLTNWIRQYHTTLHNNNMALQFYESNSLKNRYQEWLGRLLEAKASSWRSYRTKYIMLSRWMTKTTKSGQFQYIAETNRQLQLCTRVYQIWHRKTISRLADDQKAKSYYFEKLSRVTILKWRKEIGIIPAKHTIQTEVATRIQKNAFEIWLHRAREERRAAQFNRKKVLREAWINWQFRVRAQVFSLHRENRLMERHLRALVIEARLRLAFRVRNETHLRNSMRTWKLNWQTMKQHRWEQEEVALDTLARKRQNFVLLRWYRCMVLLQQYQLEAADFHRPQFLQRAMLEWTSKLRHLQKLDIWAQDARFYLLAAKTLSHWRTSTESTRREKRKTSYIQVRRITKSNLARSILQQWQAKAQKIILMRSRAVDLVENRSADVRINLFSYWRYRVANIANLEMTCLEKVLQKHFWTWQNRLRTIEKLKTEASLSRKVHLSYQAIKKWSLITLQLRAHENCASEIYDKNTKRRYRRSFYFWHQQAVQKISLQQDLGNNLDTLSKSVVKNDHLSESGKVTLRKNGSIFDQTVNMTPKPGYLSTPSKRSERLIAAVTAKISTTPRAPLSTPFEREVRALWSGGTLSSHRPKGLSRSRFGMSNIRTIVETPGKPMNSVARSKSP
ncbi:hypothetical protein K3495_g8383 [Podosphaera aphanis]|nr:hypothetical protein K3495_g8383 [Podosphaera aphanis]